jgi:hypothetical protein
VLKPDEFRVGDLAAAAGSGITLLLARTQYEHTALIGEALNERYGIVLSGDLPGQAYLVGSAEPWEGILVPNVVIEMDERSAFDPIAGLQTGPLVREGAVLSVVASTGSHPRVGGRLKLVLMKDLPPCDERAAVGFTDWRIVVDEGEEKRELVSVSVAKMAAARAKALNP